MMKEAGRLEQTTSGVRAEWTKLLKTKTNVFDLAVQGRRIINLRIYIRINTFMIQVSILCTLIIDDMWTCKI